MIAVPATRTRVSTTNPAANPAFTGLFPGAAVTISRVESVGGGSVGGGGGSVGGGVVEGSMGGASVGGGVGVGRGVQEDVEAM